MPTDHSKVVGIVLVRNEDVFVGQAVKNIAAFCDRILLCDHGSTDGTLGILDGLARAIPHAALLRLRHPSESHDLLQPFVGTRTWVFGVDGDEIYDPELLARFRPRIVGGEFDGIWRMKGNVLHCTSLAPDRTSATGYMAAPSRSITKLYNFAAISAWNGDTPERLHGGTIGFRPGFHDGVKRNFQESIGWNETPLRCLHTCFLPRSGLDFHGKKLAVRENIMELHRSGISGWARRAVNRLLNRCQNSRWKQEHYRLGLIETVDALPFFL